MNRFIVALLYITGSPGLPTIGAALIACVLVPAQAWAVEAEDLQRCAQISADAERLACYDELSARVASEPPSSPEPEPTREERFGLEPAPLPDAASEIISELVSTRTNAQGKLVFSLGNGQVWRQTDYARLIVKKSETRRVIISKTAIGSYWLKLEGGGRRVRVKRVQ
ncbi:MAG: hypothetical protein V3V67_13910 [Myxococcota bacterium]